MEEARTCSESLKQRVDKPEKGNTKYAIFVLGGVFVLSLLSLLYLYTRFPELEEEEKSHIKVPRDIVDAKLLGQVLYRYKDKYFYEVLVAVFVSYLFLQTFAIPGSISLSILSGFLFPFPLALLLVCFCSATGATFCYLLSMLVGRPIVWKYFPQKIKQWADTVERHRGHILNYMIFLRITPFLPNWFINISAPVIDVPVIPFWVGTFVGVAPPSFVAIQAGTTLHQLTSSGDTFSFTSVALIGLFAILSLVPVFLKNRLREKFE
ncbi:transmembrane protein 41B-like [Hetaerina americana]|uniref:transmembrane protein 41B-like n=1 Tax=Hetaerina americana TaxID=62018 RepID=UPI003A7F5C37